MTVQQLLIAAQGATGAPPFTPASLAGLIGWWDLQVFSSITSSSGVVTNLADQSGVGNHLGNGSISNKPAYNATGLNSRPTMVFASNEFFNTTSAAFPMGTGNTLTVFAVVILNNAAGASNYGRVINYVSSGADYNNVGSWTLARDASSPQIDFARNSVIPFSSLSYSVPHRIIVTVNSSGVMTVYVDGVAGTPATSAGNWVSNGTLRVGTDLTSYWNGNMSELGVATGFTNSTDVASLDLYLKNKWGL